MKTQKTESLGDRMKQYEEISKTRLIKRMPVIIRLDGKAFHTFTRGLTKPYSIILSEAMKRTTLALCSEIQGCCFGYTQSDEITLVLQSYKSLKTSAWFDNEVQKICSVSASMATYWFNRYFHELTNDYDTASLIQQELTLVASAKITPDEINPDSLPIGEIINKYQIADNKTKMFDSRCFNLSKEEVANCLIWRQQDATRNSIEALGQALFSHSQLQNKSCANIQDMLVEKYGINWNNIPVTFKRGACVIYKDNEWVIDNDIPIFTQDRDYIETKINFD